MKFFVFILSALFSFKAQAINPNTQCALDERPLLLEYSFKDDKSKSVFEIKQQDKIINYKYEHALSIKNNKSVGLVTEVGFEYRAFKKDNKIYYLDYEKRLATKEVCYPLSVDADKEKLENRDYSDVEFSCYQNDRMDEHFSYIDHSKFYQDSEVDKLKKNILKTKDKALKLKKTYKLKYSLEGDVFDVEVLARAKVNPNQFKAYRCQEGSKILVCGENCLNYSKLNLPKDQFSSERFRINLKDTKAQYLIEFELYYYSQTSEESYDQEKIKELLNKKLKDWDQNLDLKELTAISKTITDGNPFNIFSIRVLKYI